MLLKHGSTYQTAKWHVPCSIIISCSKKLLCNLQPQEYYDILLEQARLMPALVELEA